MKRIKKINVLVTAVGGDISQSVIKCLKNSQYDVRITGCDINPYAAGRVDVDCFLQCPPVKEKGRYLDFLLEVINQQKIEYVFPLFEPEIMLYIEHREFFKSSIAHFVVNSDQIIQVFSDKLKTVQWFKKNDIMFPETYCANEYNGQMDFPVILKKRSGSGSQGLVKITDSDDLEFHLKRGKNLIVQEYLPGDNSEYTAGLFGDGKKVYSICFRRKLAPGGFSQEVELVNNQRMNIFLQKVGRSLDLKGSVNIQFRDTGKGYVPFEINPRFSSTVYFRHVFGFRDVEWSIKLIQGSKIHYFPPYKKGIGVRKFSEIFFDLNKEEKTES